MLTSRPVTVGGKTLVPTCPVNSKSKMLNIVIFIHEKFWIMDIWEIPYGAKFSDASGWL